MAIGPKDLGNLNTEDQNILKALEAYIDAKLEETFAPGGKSTFLFSTMSERINKRVTLKVKRELIKRYTDAGWLVNIDYNGGPETEYLQFEEPIQTAKAPDEGPPVAPSKMVREDPDNPYARKKLNSK